MCSLHAKLFFVIFLAAFSLFSLAHAADSTASESSTTTVTPTTTSEVLRDCDQLSVMDFDIQRISGTWYELARKNYGTYIQNVQCLEMDITYMNGTAWVYQTYAMNITELHLKNTYKYMVHYDKTNASNYEIIYTDYNYLPVPVYKILDTDYDNYLVVCSYLTAWQKAAAAFVYFRDRDTTDEEVYSVVNEAGSKYIDFTTNMNLVYQGRDCFSSVSRALPMATVMLVLFAIHVIKLINF